tara:strand:+ start:319 stop:741 length:423 start_codon:yes stop_codon:yes gene_type:complete
MECQVFSFADPDQEVLPDGPYMSAVVGEALSVGVVTFRLPRGPEVAPKSHAHGEELTFQLRGGCTENLGDSVETPDGSVELEAGRAMLMPAEQPHLGLNRYDDAGWRLRLNVVSPPRAEYGARGAPRAYCPTDTGKGEEA